MKIKDLSIADLKAAYDFVLIDLKDLEAKAKKEGISADRIPAYREVKDIENRLYHQLLNITRDLE
ncbi:MAG: hypothetical protein ABIP27_09435 [Flavobacterium circumlabens]|uniref:hypothetical protein n=1 Tax=Flavobacterium circumlabens TaxID=2133765 RepID=UPI003263DF01